MKPTKQLLATLLTLIMLLGLLPGAGAVELSAEYGETRYSDIASTTYSRMLMLKNNAFVAANEAGKYGLVSVTGEVKLPYEYDVLYLTRDGVYLAEKDGKKLLIDAEGNVKINSTNKIKLLETPGLYYADSKLYNPQGEVKLENVESHDWPWFPAVPAQNGVLDVGNGKYYTADGLQESNVFVWQGATSEGAEKLKGYDRANRMSHNWYDTNVDYFLVEKNNQRGVTDLEGNVVLALGDYTSIDAVEDGNDVSFVVSAAAGEALFNAQGQKVVDFGTYSSIWSDGCWDRTHQFVIWEGLFSVENASGQTGKIDASGKVILPMGNYGQRLPGLNQKGFIAAKDGEVYKLYNREGQLVKTFDHYVATEVYYRDLVFANTLESGYDIKYGVMNENGTTLVQPEFSSDIDKSIRWSPDNMLRATKEDSKVVLYDENYSPVYTDYEGIEYISEGRYLLYDGNYYGIGKNDGTFTVLVEYEDIRVHNPQIIELYNGETYRLTNVDGDALVLPSTEESKLYGINPWAEFAPEWIDWTFSANLDDTDYLKSAYDGDEGNIIPFLSKTTNGTTTTYLDYHTGEIIGTLPVEASNILPSGEFVFKDAAGKFGIGKLIQDLLPVKVTVTPPAGVAYGTTLGDPVAQQEAISDGVDASATWSYLYEGTTRAGEAYSSATKPTQAGTYTVTATLVSETHTGSKKSAAFTIAPKTLAADMLTVSGTYTYTGSAITPTYAVADGNLLKSTDYTAAVSDNLNAGSGKVTVIATQTGNYTGSAEKTFVIAPKSLKSAGISAADIGSYVYTSSELKPAVTVKNGAVALISSIDYTPAYTDNTGVGTAKITLTGKGNYSESIEKTFAITAASVSGTVIITGSDYQVGTVLTADVSAVVGGGFTYQWGRDGVPIPEAAKSTYTLADADSGKKLSVKVTASGNYAGALTSAEIEVGKAPLNGTLTLNKKEGIIALTANGLPAAEGSYTVQWLRDGKEMAGVSGESYTITAADKGCSITVKAIAAGETYTGELLSNTIAVPATAPGAPVVSAAAGDGQVTVSWTVPDHGGSAITGYALQMGENMAITLGANISSYTFTGLTNGSAYSFRVTASSTIGTGEAGSANATPTAPSYSGGGSSSNTTTETVKNPDGSTTKTVTDKKTSLVTITTTNTDGSKVETTIPKGGEAISTVTVPKGKTSKVTIPAKETKPGTVVVIVKADGTEEIVKTSVATDGGVKFVATGDVTVKLVDNSKSFADVDATNWAASAVAFATSRELFNGTGKESFSPAADMSRAMLVTVLARLDGQDTTKGDTWDAVGVAWAKEQGISDGKGLTGAVSREQLAVMLYRYAKADKTETNLKDFSDVDSVSSWAADAMNWAVASGIITGKAGALDPQGNASRAEVATMLERFVGQMIK